ncbi:MAG: ROK family protein [Phycisphaerales bacterium]|nr:ROK family protein [Phycisphaerales bacterium]
MDDRGNPILGLDIGGTKTAVVLGDRAGTIHDRIVFGTRPERGFEPTFHELLASLAEMRSRAPRITGRSAGAISVSIGGPLQIEPGIILSPPNLPGWDHIPLRDRLVEATGLPTFIEHDGNAGALAEWYFGAGRGRRHLVFLTLGTGLGAGLILNGDLFRGASDTAGEIGHIRLADSGPVAYGKAGSWEALCSGSGIARLAAHRFPHRWPAGPPDLPTLADFARAGDPEATQVFDEAGRWLGRGLALLIDTLNPELILLGSLAIRLGDLLLPPARAELAREALPTALSACEILPAALGDRHGDVASLCAAIRALK